jgi:hypothetical protein
MKTMWEDRSQMIGNTQAAHWVARGRDGEGVYGLMN